MTRRLLLTVPFVLLPLLFAACGGGSAAPPSPPLTATAAASAIATATATATPTPVLIPSPLDGTMLTEAEWQQRRGLSPLAVMLDNSPEAFPHAGLDRADLVYEAFVEGGMTRLMAVFWRFEAPVVAPVRSARTPFVIWASELDALYAHGGSAETDNEANAAGQIYEWEIKDLEAFANVSSAAYYRDGDRAAPHDLSTATERLRSAARALEYPASRALPVWRFSDAPPAGGVAAQGIEVDWSEARHATRLVQWRWDNAARRYLRFRLGGPDLDAVTRKQLAFTTVIVMRVPNEVVDFGGHVLLDQYGEGEAMVFAGGAVRQAKWQKKNREDRTRLYDLTGAEIVFPRGPIFIEVVAPSTPIRIAAASSGLEPMPPYERRELPPTPTPAGR